MKTAVRVAVLVLVGAGLLFTVVSHRASQRRATAEGMLNEFVADLAAVEVSDAGRAYIEGMARRFHDEGFKAAHDDDGTVTGGVVNVNAYQRAVLERMIAQARADGSEEIVAALRKYQREGATLDLRGER